MRNLTDFLSKHHNLLLFIALEAASLTLLVRFNCYQSSVWFTSANAITGHVSAARAAVMAFFSLVKANEQLTAKNFYLERQLNNLRYRYAQLTDDTLILQRTQLEAVRQYSLVSAKVVSNSLTGTGNLLTIDRGETDGVHPDMGVVCGLGVVGVVYQTGQHYSIVLPVLNSRSNISCRIRRREYFGNLRWDGGDPTIAYLEDIPRHARFARGEFVETSGYSAIFPPGVVVGRIETVYNSPDGLSYRVQVRLTTDFGCLRDVAVVADTTVAERARLMEAARDSLRRDER